MNKINKYRAWDRKEKRMIYEALEIKNIGLGDGSVIVDERAQLGNELDWMQFINLKDYNGKEIFEGDIVRICREDDYDLDGEDKLNEFADDGWKIVEVKFNEDMAGYTFDGDGLFGDEYQYAIVTEQYVTEVIGNIWENPELLKQ